MSELAFTSKNPQYPVSVRDAKLTARVDTDAENALFTRLIAAATRSAEQYLGYKLMADTWNGTITGTNETVSIELPVQFLSYTAVFYVDGMEVTQEEANVTIDFSTDSLTQREWMNISFNDEATVELEVLDGAYSDPSQVIEDIRFAIELQTEDLYQNRSQSGICRPAKNLLFPHKIVLV